MKKFFTNKRMFIIGFFGIIACIVLITFEKIYLKTSWMAIPAVVSMALFVTGITRQIIKVTKEIKEYWDSLGNNS